MLLLPTPHFATPQNKVMFVRVLVGIILVCSGCYFVETQSIELIWTIFPPSDVLFTDAQQELGVTIQMLQDAQVYVKYCLCGLLLLG